MHTFKTIEIRQQICSFLANAIHLWTSWNLLLMDVDILKKQLDFFMHNVIGGKKKKANIVEIKKNPEWNISGHLK